MTEQRQELTDQEKEILDYADALLKDAPEKFYVLASELLDFKKEETLDHPSKPFLLRVSLLNKIYKQIEIFIQYGKYDLAYQYHVLYGEYCEHDMYDVSCHEGNEIVDEHYRYTKKYYADEQDEFIYTVMDRLLQQGDHKKAFKYYAERFGIEKGSGDTEWDYSEIRSLSKNEISWYDRFFQAALKEGDLESARSYAQGQTILYQIAYERKYCKNNEEIEDYPTNPRLTEIEGFEEAMQTYESLVDIALKNNRRVIAFKILSDIQDFYLSPFIGKGTYKWLSESDKQHYNDISHKLQILENEPVTLISIFTQLKENFAKQEGQKGPKGLEYN